MRNENGNIIRILTLAAQHGRTFLVRIFCLVRCLKKFLALVIFLREGSYLWAKNYMLEFSKHFYLSISIAWSATVIVASGLRFILLELLNVTDDGASAVDLHHLHGSR